MFGKRMSRSEWYIWQIERGAMRDQIVKLESENSRLQGELATAEVALDGCTGISEANDALRYQIDTFQKHGYVPDLLIDHDSPVCEICHEAPFNHQGDALFVTEHDKEVARLREEGNRFATVARHEASQRLASFDAGFAAGVRQEQSAATRFRSN